MCEADIPEPHFLETHAYFSGTVLYDEKAVPSLAKIGWRAQAIWTLLTSMFKREWTINDYPVRVWRLPASEPSGKSRLKPLEWTARVFNWPGMSGSANSRLEALEELHKNFDRFKATHPNLPRPGTKVPVEFATSERVGHHSELAKDFVKSIFDVEWAWISDESSLADFHDEETNETLIKKIRQIYGVDVSDISSGNLADILDRISNYRAVPPNS